MKATNVTDGDLIEMIRKAFNAHPKIVAEAVEGAHEALSPIASELAQRLHFEGAEDMVLMALVPLIKDRI